MKEKAMEKVERYEIEKGAYVVSTRGSARDRSALRREVEQLAEEVRAERGAVHPAVALRPAQKVTPRKVTVVVHVVTATGNGRVVRVTKPATPKKRAAPRPASRGAAAKKRIGKGSRPS
jgi:hypothetical protein